MRVTGFFVVICSYNAVGLTTCAVIHFAGWKDQDLALIIAAIVATQAGIFVWHRQAPNSQVGSVKLGLGIVLSITAVVFASVLQAVSSWLLYPEVTIPIAASGSIAFPFAIGGPMWKALDQPQSM